MFGKFFFFFFGDADFSESEADELTHKRLRQASAPRRPVRKPLGIAHAGAMLFLKTSFRSVFGKTGA